VVGRGLGKPGGLDGYSRKSCGDLLARETIYGPIIDSMVAFHNHNKNRYRRERLQVTYEANSDFAYVKGGNFDKLVFYAPAASPLRCT
jgi:hypothetical protein